MTTFLQTTYRDDRDASALLRYIGRDQPLRNRTGREMTDTEIEEFIAESDRRGFERDVILSPENGGSLTPDDFSLHARQVMNEFLTDRPTATYCYATHQDTDHPHVHVALTGERRDLFMDRDDIEQVRDHANELFVERHRGRDLQQEQTTEQEQDRDRDRGHSW